MSRTVGRCFSLVVLTLVAVCLADARQQPSVKSTPERERAALLRTDEEFNRRSLEKGMSAAFLEFLGEGAVMLPAGGPMIEGSDRIRKLLEEPSSGSVLTWTPLHAEVSASLDLGYTYGTYESRSVDQNGKPTVHFGKYVSVWRKQEGKWKWVVDVGNASPPPEQK